MKIPTKILELAARLNLGQQSDRSRQKQRHLEFQKLEDRNLLAGDVTVFIDNINLMVIGDSADNQIQIVGTDTGSATVIGLNGTTINGGTADFVANMPGLRTAFVQLNEGNDEVDILAARFMHGITLQGNDGNDKMMIRHSSIGSLNANAGAGADVLELQDVFVIRDSFVNMHTGDDLLVIYNHAAGGDISLQGGSGDDSFIVDQMGMFGKLTINTASGNDKVLMAGESWVGRDSQLLLGIGDDFLGVMPGQNGGKSQLQKFTRIDGGGGNDNIALDAAVSLRESIEFDGNAGTDNFNNQANIAGADPRIIRFENGGFDINAAMDSVYQELVNEGIDPTLFGGSANLILAVSLVDNALAYTEGQVAQRIDPALVLSGAADTQVTSATVTIQGFVLNEDVLEFTDINGATGVFDDTTGVLTFTGTGTITEYQSALRSVAYRNSSEAPADTARSLAVQVNTADNNVSDTRELQVFAVEDLPVLNVDETQKTLDIDDSSQTRPVIVDNQLTLTDADTEQIESAVVQIVQGGQPGDVLSVTDANGITGSYEPVTGLLTLTGTATIAEYEAILQTVSFDNTENRAPLGVRTIRFEVSDGTNTVAADTSIEIVASLTIDVSNAQDNLSYSETDPATAIDDTTTINADDGNSNAIVQGATVQIGSGFDPDQDTLSFTPVAGITGSYDATTGTLTFTGDAQASDYQTLLRLVTFANSSFGDNDFSSADRVVEFTVERDGLFAKSTRTVNVVELVGDQALIQRYLDLNGLTSEMTVSGLHYIVTQAGDGNFPNENSDVTVNYRGTLLNGQEFDANDGLTFNLQNVIQGWTEGIPKFSTGGSGMLLIPSNLGYGASPPPGIPANAVLIFEVDLLSFV